ncbi:40S ribosomal protein S20 [Tupaia chinensis]|uniref:40S ribosomal protein S20 n=1 Tax=Tupaia chinensis TaxID=246437 RepID=L9L8U6_TUPCH|nr:40S ribosomal protein S20 [Tupaia chinensis]
MCRGRCGFLRKMWTQVQWSSGRPTPAPDAPVCSHRGTSKSGSPAVAMALKDTGEIPAEPEVAIHPIRITLTRPKAKALEKSGADWIRGLKEKNLKVKGPGRTPTKTSRITTRRIPCEGSKTRAHFRRRVHK